MAAIIVSTNDREWLRPCLHTLYEHAGGLDLDVVIADNESTDGTAELIADEFPAARVVSCANHGFGHANNRAALTCRARYLLFLNPDTEILDGQLADLVSLLDSRPEIGLASVKQVIADGSLFATMFRYPNALRALGEAIGYESLFRNRGWLGSRVLDEHRYDVEVDCDWLTGAFMLVRSEALLGAGMFDERFFMSAEETDLAYRIKQAGWRVMHLPWMTILHHVHMGAPLGARMEAQYALSRRVYAEKHFSPPHRAAYLAFVRLRYWLRFLAAMRPGSDRYWREAARRALRVLGRVEPPPFEQPPATAVRQATVALDVATSPSVGAERGGTLRNGLSIRST